jgi:peptide subunit release factor 1 (eRF1)
LRAAANSATDRLREAHQQDLISALLAGNRHPELNVLGRQALDEALTVRNVDTLVLSRRWVDENSDDAESLVNRAIAQNARVEIATGSAGEMLDEGTGGVGAKLRFSVAAA